MERIAREFLNRTVEQRMDALAVANEVRSARAQLKRELKAGRVSIYKLLADPPDYLKTAKVFDLLVAMPKYGPAKVNKLLSCCTIAPSKTVGGMTERQRAHLAQALVHTPTERTDR